LVGAFCGPRFGRTRASSLGFKSFNRTPAGNFVAAAKSAFVHSGLSSSMTGCLAFRDMAPHFLCGRASKADRAVSFVADGEDKTMRNTIDNSICAISGFAVIETIVPDYRENIEIDQRASDMRCFDRLIASLAGSKSVIIVYTICVRMGQAGQVPCDQALKTAFSPPAINAAQENGGNL
jgi:hypothetical protein